VPLPPFLHAGHEVRETFAELRLVSWLVIGLGLGVVVLTWGRIVAWLRAPEARPPRIQRWGEDAKGYYFEVTEPGEWRVEAADGSLHVLEPDADGSLRVPSAAGRPVALVASGGARLPL
jgi:hypothetical protein